MRTVPNSSPLSSPGKPVAKRPRQRHAPLYNHEESDNQTRKRNQREVECVEADGPPETRVCQRCQTRGEHVLRGVERYPNERLMTDKCINDEGGNARDRHRPWVMKQCYRCDEGDESDRGGYPSNRDLERERVADDPN